MTVSQLFIGTSVVSTICMVRIQAPKLTSKPSSAAAPKLAHKLKAAKRSESTPDAVTSAADLDEGKPSRAPVLKYKTKNVKGAFAKEEVKAVHKEKVKVTHKEKQAALKEQRKASQLEKKEAFKAAKKTAKKAKRTARRNAAGKNAAGRTVTTE